MNCDSTKPIGRALAWKMGVAETIDRGHITVAVINGYIYDLDDPHIVKNGKIQIERRKYLMIRVGDGKYYLLQGDEMAAAVNSLVFDLPLSRGKVFGDPEQISGQKQQIE